MGSSLNAKKDLLLNKVPWKHLRMPYAQGEEDLGRSGALLDAADAAGVDSVELCQDKSIKCIKGLTKCSLAVHLSQTSDEVSQTFIL